MPTLCIGLDVAWHGGSKRNRDSQYDCIISVIADGGDLELNCERVALINRDPDALLVRDAILKRLHEAKANAVEQVVVAIDAPLQTTQKFPPAGQKRAYRACERHLNNCRKEIDQKVGGSKGWHPNLQPGIPLAPRVETLLKELQNQNFEIWSKDHFSKRLIVECFPAEAIWSAKRLGHYKDSVDASFIKKYKNQKGKDLSNAEVRRIAKDVMNAFQFVSDEWPSLVEQITTWLLEDVTWLRNGYYRGGKLLDDVIDSMISLGTALAYSSGKAHVWQDPLDPDDGHIIGPGL